MLSECIQFQVSLIAVRFVGILWRNTCLTASLMIRKIWLSVVRCAMLWKIFWKLTSFLVFILECLVFLFACWSYTTFGIFRTYYCIWNCLLRKIYFCSWVSVMWFFICVQDKLGKWTFFVFYMEQLTNSGEQSVQQNRCLQGRAKTRQTTCLDGAEFR